MKDIITVTNNVPMTTSLKVAEVFEKENKNVLQSIDMIRATLKTLELPELNFQPVEIIKKNAIGGEYTEKHYIMDRDAFSVLAFGFTGEKALKFKIDFIKAFNEMELELMKTNADLIDPSDLPLALETLAAHIRRSKEPALKKAPLFPEPEEEKYETVTQNLFPEFPTEHAVNPKPLNMGTGSVRNSLPGLGLRPIKTTNWLVRMGYLKKIQHECDPTTTRKIPTPLGDLYFTTTTDTLGLYITERGIQFMQDLKEKGHIPQDCLLHQTA